MGVLDDPMALSLSEDEMLSLLEKRPQVQAKKLMSVLKRKNASLKELEMYHWIRK